MPAELGQWMDPDRARSGLCALDPPAGFHIDGDNDHGRISAMESRFYLRNQLLRDTDWSAMAHSVEVRTPLVDITLTRRLAPNLACCRGKSLLAQAALPPLPAVISARDKTGFSTPIARWMRQSELLADRSGRLLRDGAGAHWSRSYALMLHALHTGEDRV
jgi:asparagine synthase (glutamine-hydrolysing)